MAQLIMAAVAVALYVALRLAWRDDETERDEAIAQIQRENERRAW